MLPHTVSLFGVPVVCRDSGGLLLKELRRRGSSPHPPWDPRLRTSYRWDLGMSVNSSVTTHTSGKVEVTYDRLSMSVGQVLIFVYPSKTSTQDMTGVPDRESGLEVVPVPLQSSQR